MMCSEIYSLTMLMDHLVFNNLSNLTLLIVLVLRFNSTRFHMEIAKETVSLIKLSEFVHH